MRVCQFRHGRIADAFTQLIQYNAFRSACQPFSPDFRKIEYGGLKEPQTESEGAKRKLKAVAARVFWAGDNKRTPRLFRMKQTRRLDIS